MISREDAPTAPDFASFLGHMRQGTHIFGVHYGDSNVFLNMPKPEDAPFPTRKTLDPHYQRVSWQSDTTPYLLFVPRDNAFHGPLFQSLRTPKRGFRAIRYGRRGWKLSNSILGPWEDLEKRLRGTLNAMLDMHRGGLSNEMLPWEIPSWKFDRFQKTRREAEDMASRARDAFLPMMGATTMMFIILDARGPDDWRYQILDPKYQTDPRYNVDPQFFASLQVSVVGDVNIPRIGGIFDFSQHPYGEPRLTPRHRLEWLFHLIVDQLPVALYFYWGEITDRPEYPIPGILESHKFYPDFQEIQYLLNLPGKVAFSPWSRADNGKIYSDRDDYPYKSAQITGSDRSHPVADAVPAAPVASLQSPVVDSPQHHDEAMPRFPKPEADSGQRYGENYDAFFARRKQRNLELAETETAAGKQKRLQREANAARGAPPGKAGARVFVWEEDQPGFFIRRSLNRFLAADSWDEFTVGQRLFDSFRNEWDLCTALAPHEEPEIEDDSSDAEDGGPDMHLPPDTAEFPEGPDISDGSLPEEEQVQSPPTIADLLRAHGVSLEPGQIPDAPPPEYEPYHDMSEIPFARFGFTRPMVPPSTSHPPLSMVLCKKSLGDERWPGIQHPKYEHFPLLLGCLDAAQSLKDLPSELVDLRQDTAEISDESKWSVSVSTEMLSGHLFYVLTPKDYREPYPLYVLVPNAATALMAVRMGWGPDPREIIYHLLEHGVEFRVCLRASSSKIPRPPPPPRFTGLGYRRVDYKPTVADYEIYVVLRDRFLTSPRGRAALFAGGIVGRLAREVVDEELASLGPSSDVFLTGLRLWDGVSKGAYWDDVLTEQEIDFICGVYEVATGRINRKSDDIQTAQISWWPKPNSFTTSGLNTGWWSPDCDHWFEQRLANIKSGNARLYTQTEWKRYLKYYKKSRDIAVANERIAIEFLSTKLV